MRLYRVLLGALKERDELAAKGKLVGCFGLNGSIRQNFCLYREKEERVKMSKKPPPVPTKNAVGPYPTIIQISSMPRR